MCCVIKDGLPAQTVHALSCGLPTPVIPAYSEDTAVILDIKQVFLAGLVSLANTTAAV